MLLMVTDVKCIEILHNVALDKYIQSLSLALFLPSLLSSLPLLLSSPLFFPLLSPLSSPLSPLCSLFSLLSPLLSLSLLSSLSWSPFIDKTAAGGRKHHEGNDSERIGHCVISSFDNKTGHISRLSLGSTAALQAVPTSLGAFEEYCCRHNVRVYGKCLSRNVIDNTSQVLA